MAHATMDREIMEEDGYDDVTSQRRERTPHADEGSHRQGRTISRGWRRAGRATAILLVVAMIWGGQRSIINTIHAAQESVDAKKIEVRRTVDRELWLAENGRPDQLASIIDAEADPAWRASHEQAEPATHTGIRGERLPTEVAVDAVELHGDLARVTVRVAQLDPASPVGSYRETRFYRTTAQGWVRTSPQPSLWGATQRIEAGQIIVSYRKSDEETVESAMPTIIAIDRDIRRSLGLSQRGEGVNLYVDVVPENDHDTQRVTEHSVRIPSPALSPLPEGDNETDLLLATLRRALAQQAIAEASRNRPIDWRWRLVFEGFEDALALAEPIAPNFWSQENSLGLNDLLLNGQDWFYAGDHAQRARAAEALVWYVGTEHGQTAQARLFRAIGDDKGWAEIIPAIFDIPVTEFEMDRQAHLLANAQSGSTQ